MSEFDATQEAEELAEKMQIDLAEVEGTGKDGRILKSDVEELAVEEVAGEDESPEEIETDFHTVVRGISKTGRMIESGAGNYFPSNQVDAYIRSWMIEGYEVQQTFYLGDAPEGFNMMYVLVRQ